MMKNLALWGLAASFGAACVINVQLWGEVKKLEAERVVYFETLKNYNQAYTELRQQLKSQPPKNLRIITNYQVFERWITNPVLIKMTNLNQ